MSVIERERVAAPAVVPAVENPDVRILRRAADILEYELGWCQNAYGQTKDGYPIDPGGQSIVASVCAMGALWTAVLEVEGKGESKSAALDRAYEVSVHVDYLVGHDLPSWNDTEGRTKDEVVAVLRQTADSID